MAKIIKGARRGDDPLINYSIYTDPKSGRVVRRAANPEAYLHSNSKKVKEVRETFAQAMVTYSQMDIITKQAYSEAVRWKTLSPLNPYLRRLVEIILKRIKEMPPPPPPPLPIHVIEELPWTNIQPIPSNKPRRWDYLDWLKQHLPKKYYNRGYKQILYDEYAKRQMPNPYKWPFPTEIPQEEKNITKDRTPAKFPTILVIEIEPTGLSGAAYEAYIWVKTEYQEIKRFISTNKKEVIIIVAIGAFILFGWTILFKGGLELVGKELLVHEAVKTPELLAALSGLGLPFTFVKDYFYKKLVLGWAKNIDVWAWNDSKSWICYKETTTSDNEILFSFYEGNSADNKGKLAAWVRLEVDPETQMGILTWGCGDSEDRIIVFYNGAELLRCNIGLTPYDIVDVWDNTKKEWLRSEVEYKENQIIRTFYQGGLGCGEIKAYAYPVASPITWGIYVCWQGGTKYFSWIDTPYWDGRFHDVPCDQIEGYIWDQIWPAPHWYLIVFTGHKGYWLDPATLPAWPGSCPDQEHPAVRVIETLDNNGEVQSIEVQDLGHTGELWVYWRGILIEILPP